MRTIIALLLCLFNQAAYADDYKVTFYSLLNRLSPMFDLQPEFINSVKNLDINESQKSALMRCLSDEQYVYKDEIMKSFKRHFSLSELTELIVKLEEKSSRTFVELARRQLKQAELSEKQLEELRVFSLTVEYKKLDLAVNDMIENQATTFAKFNAHCVEPIRNL